MSAQEPNQTILSIAQFISRFRVFLISLGIALFVGLIVFIFFSVSNSNKLNESALLFEKSQELLQQYENITEKDKKAKLDEYLVSLQEIITKFPDTWYHQRALILRGNTYFDSKDYEKAKADYNQAALVRPNTVMAGFALFSESSVAYEMKKLDEAIAICEKLYSEYKDISPLVPRALLVQASFYEEKSDFKKAGSVYEKLINEFPESGWTKVAIDHIINLKSQNKL